MSLSTEVAEYVATICAEPDVIVRAPQVARAFINQEVVESRWVEVRLSEYEGLYGGVIQSVREALRHLYPAGEEDATSEQAMLDLPEESLLQGRYSVPERDDNGDVQRDSDGRWLPVYKTVSQMSSEDITWRIRSFRKLGQRYLRHADALEAGWNRLHDTESAA
jgi:hypothetical protein